MRSFKIGAALVALLSLGLAACTSPSNPPPAKTWTTMSISDEDPAKKSKVDEDETALAQCRVDAIVAYMTTQGFSDGDYIVGEDRVDWDVAEVNNAGSAAFGQIHSREELADVFVSTEPAYVAARASKLAQLPDYPAEVVLNVNNWEAIQLSVDIDVPGNTGFVGGTVVSLGTRESVPGEVIWFFIDPGTCIIPFAAVTCAGEPVPEDTPDADRPVPAFRAACANCVDGLQRKSGNPNDYRQPGDDGLGDDVGSGTKPHATRTSVESSAAVVETERVGSSGVTDSATNNPGSETGGSAPESDTTPRDDDPPPDEGDGDNDGEVGGF